MILLTTDMPHRAAYTQKKIDALEWTPHMDECLQMIAQYPVRT